MKVNIVIVHKDGQKDKKEFEGVLEAQSGTFSTRIHFIDDREMIEYNHSDYQHVLTFFYPEPYLWQGVA